MSDLTPSSDAPSHPIGRSWTASLVAVALSLLLHGLLVAAPLVIERRQARQAKLLWFKVLPPPRVPRPVVERKPPPPPRPRPRPRPRRPAVAQRPTAAANPDTPPPPPVFGASKESVTDGESTFTVPLGNTVATSPEHRGPLKEGQPEPAPPPPPPPRPRPVTLRRPPKILQEVKVPYPSRARGLGVEGTVRVRVLVGPDGTVRRAQVISGPGFGLNEAAREALLKFRFEPAIGSDGKPMAWWITYSYAFEIND